MIDTLRRLMVWTAGLVGGTAVLALMVVTLGDAVMRGFGNPILGANEMTQALLLVVVAAALPVSIVSGKAIAIEGLVDRLPPGLSWLIILIGTLVSGALMAFLAYHSYLTAADARDFGERSAILHIPFDVLYIILSIGMVGAAMAFIVHWLLTRQASRTDPQLRAGGPDH